jgi:spore coat protein U-like protein
MKKNLLQSLAALGGMLVAQLATAAITCNISSAGFATTYPVSSPSIVVVPASYTISCARGLVTDPTTTTYTVRANNGLNPSSGNRSSAAGFFLRYDVYSDNTCTTDWRTNPQAVRLPVVPGTITMTGLLATVITENYWACIPAGISRPAGTYVDTVTMNPLYSAGVLGGTSTFSVSIVTPPTCSITSGPGTITLNYTAFGGSVSANTNMDVTCSATLPYTMSVSPATAVLTGINYGLTLPGGGTGTGVAQTHTITGTAAAGQAGTCSGGPCTATQSTTVTITY